MSKKYVIVGGSAAGPKVAAKIRRLDEEAEITIVQKGKYLSMASCGYPYFVGGLFDDPKLLISTPTGVPRDPDFYFKVKGIQALVETEAQEIDREKKTVTIQDLKSGRVSKLPYDKLILTTGAQPVKPPIPGIDLDGIDTLQSMEDAVTLKAVAKEKKAGHVVIVGGGLIGIETCEAFALAGIRTTVVEMLDQVLPFLDWEMAKLVENHMKSKGIEVLTNRAVVRFQGTDGRVTGVEVSGGEVIPCDHVVFSIGVRPNGALASKAGLRVGDSGGITVNRFMQTNDPDIYAAGDCTEITNLITQNKQHWPMGDAANLQGRVVAQNAVHGNIEEYNGMIGTGICKVFDYTAAAPVCLRKWRNGKDSRTSSPPSTRLPTNPDSWEPLPWSSNSSRPNRRGSFWACRPWVPAMCPNEWPWPPWPFTGGCVFPKWSTSIFPMPRRSRRPSTT
jgi:NADPH-dependent 2,4-dienoyl-CoA reductase/sulfur reductase-like enzyme